MTAALPCSFILSESGSWLQTSIAARFQLRDRCWNHSLVRRLGDSVQPRPAGRWCTDTRRERYRCCGLENTNSIGNLSSQRAIWRVHHAPIYSISLFFDQVCRPLEILGAQSMLYRLIGEPVLLVPLTGPVVQTLAPDPVGFGAVAGVTNRQRDGDSGTNAVPHPEG